MRARAAAGLNTSAFVAEAIAEKLADMSAVHPSPGPSSHEEFVARLRRASSRPPGPGASLDDSRESIYAGRGE